MGKGKLFVFTVLFAVCTLIATAMPTYGASGCFGKDVQASRDAWKAPFHAVGKFLGKTVSGVPVLYQVLQGGNMVVLGAGGDAVGTTLGVVGGVVHEATGCK
ncbi:MAG: hypothetical protein AAB527_00130 [Patescibacteria group bacterium]